MLIRSFTLDDFPAADALWRRTDGVGTVPREELERVLQVAPELVLVAEEDVRVVGAVVGTDDGRRGWIFRLAVDETVRGRGVGKALVEEVERRLLARGVRHVRLLVHTDNQAGLGFWSHAGYEGWDIVMFGKSLEPDGEGHGAGAGDASAAEHADRC